jgi:hypothetical protein
VLRSLLCRRARSGGRGHNGLAHLTDLASVRHANIAAIHHRPLAARSCSKPRICGGGRIPCHGTDSRAGASDMPRTTASFDPERWRRAGGSRSARGWRAHRPMTQFRGAGCQCARVAVTHRKIHNYRQVGRLTLRKPGGLGPPRPDRSPVEPHCIRHLLQFSEERLGKASGLGSRQTDYGGHGTPAGARDRLRGPR